MLKLILLGLGAAVAVLVIRSLYVWLAAAVRCAIAHRHNTRSNRLADEGRSEDGLVASSKAAALCRRLVKVTVEYEPDLAVCLGSLANRLHEVGRYDEAVAPSHEGVAVLRRLAAADPAHEPDLAIALNNLSPHLCAAGRSEQGLAASEESVALYERLVESQPALLPRLALAQNNLSLRLDDVGRHEEALAVSHETIDIHLGLASADEAELAMALNSLSTNLAAAQRSAEGMAASEQAVALQRGLAHLEPRRRRMWRLAIFLSNMASRLDELDHREDAVAATKEAVGLYEQLADADPVRHKRDLDESLHNLAARKRALERGVPVVTEKNAIAVLRRIEAEYPGAFELDPASEEGALDQTPHAGSASAPLRPAVPDETAGTVAVADPVQRQPPPAAEAVLSDRDATRLGPLVTLAAVIRVAAAVLLVVAVVGGQSAWTLLLLPAFLAPDTLLGDIVFAVVLASFASTASGIVFAVSAVVGLPAALAIRRLERGPDRPRRSQERGV